jgi:hypothetical protein
VMFNAKVSAGRRRLPSPRLTKTGFPGAGVEEEVQTLLSGFVPSPILLRLALHRFPGLAISLPPQWFLTPVAQDYGKIYRPYSQRGAVCGA